MDNLPEALGEWGDYIVDDDFYNLVGPLKMQRIEGCPSECLRLGVVIEDRHCNVFGICHGGFLATFLDIALGANVRHIACNGIPTPTISLALDYLLPANKDHWLESRVKILSSTSSICVVEGKIISGGRVVVRGNAIFKRAK
jgi:uncharacterized protein (TIGR00369 family)